MKARKSRMAKKHETLGPKTICVYFACVLDRIQWPNKGIALDGKKYRQKDGAQIAAEKWYSVLVGSQDGRSRSMRAYREDSREPANY